MADETILVVDDGKENREFIVEYVLEPNGFRYLTAGDGLEGLQLAVEHRPDLMLLDLEMPRLRGDQVLEKLAEHNIDIPVILMTFHGSEEIAVEVYRLGVKDYIKKPYYPEEMLEAIDRALSETRLRREKEALTERVLYANRNLQRRIQELHTLYDVGKNVTSIMEMERLLPGIVESAIQLTGAEEGKLYLIEQRKLLCRAQKTRGNASARAAHIELRDPVALHCARNGKALTLNEQQLQKNPVPGNPISVVCVPLILRERTIGVLSVSNFRANAPSFTREDTEMLTAIGDYAAIAIENSRNYTHLQQARERVRETFERFVPPSVVEKALTSPDEVLPGGKRQLISVLFADIRGYTAWSENAAPEQVIETLNHYLSLAAGVILGWEGTLDKFMGDGLMAIFNAPEEQPDHVHRVTDAALALMKAAREVQMQHGHNLTYSVGVNVGEAVVGYVGTSRALNYTAIGDTVNLTKRLQESASPGQILVEESVVQALKDKIRVRQVGELQVKGRQKPARAYELLDLI